MEKKNNFSIQKSVEGVPLALIYKEKQLTFRNVTEKELLQLRASGNPGFVYKLKNILFYTEIDPAYRFVNSLANGCEHKCNNCHLVSTGCPKVADLGFSKYEMMGQTPMQALISSKRIEKYPFIEEGFEAFNIAQETLFIINCLNNTPCSEKSKKLSIIYKKELIENLEDFYMNSLS